MRLGIVVKKFRSTLALALVLWCAGAGCMLVSYAHAAAVNDVGTRATNSAPGWSGVTASTGTQSSCHARHGSSDLDSGVTARTEQSSGWEQISLPATPASSGAMNCCPLTSGSIVNSSRPQGNDETATALTLDSSSSFALENSQPAPRACPLRLPNQNQTYLRCCVFLI